MTTCERCNGGRVIFVAGYRPDDNDEEFPCPDCTDTDGLVCESDYYEED